MSPQHGGRKAGYAAPLPRSCGAAVLSTVGFTLIEVLVVLAILVILFGLLFTPLMTGMEMFTQGERTVARQNAVSLAYKQVSQELAGAYYILTRDEMFTNRPTPLEAATAAAGALQYDFSRITFIPAAPGTSGVPQPSVVEFRVGLSYDSDPFDDHPDPAQPYNDVLEPGKPLNTYVLYRGQWSANNLAAAWAKWAGGNPPDVLSALTAKGEFDIPGNTIFLDSSQIAEGYWLFDPVSGSSNYVHQVRGVQFVPEQVVGEELQMDPLGMQYVARHGYWEGPQDTATTVINGTISGPMAVRITVYRWDPTATPPSYQPIADTDPDPTRRVASPPNPATCRLAYDSYRGRVVAARTVWAAYPAQSGFPTLTQVTANEYDLPDPGGGASWSPNWKIVPGSVRVYYGNSPNWKRYVPSDATASELATFEYKLAEELEKMPWAVNTSHITFSSSSPPDTTAGRIWVTFQCRNNFYVDPSNPSDPSNGTDDIVRVDYFTRELIGTVVTVAGLGAVEKVDPDSSTAIRFNEALTARQAGVIRVQNMPLSPSAQ